ncbi:hypothetical protein F4811DRAFT_573037 [Daldinia bambusicola]|nr:hypothetical protein F4811DRAFT_573037 [Daldinia bambusicola]
MPSSQSKKGSDGSSPGVGLEGASLGLEVSPDPFGFPEAFNVLDYYTGGDPGEGIPGGDAPDVPLEGSGWESYGGEAEDAWLGVPLPGHFPISNWLADRVNNNDTRNETCGDTGYSCPPEQSVDTQLANINQDDLGFGPNMESDFDFSSFNFDSNMGSDFDLSSLNFSPLTGQPSSSAEEQSGLSTGARSEKGSNEHLTRPDFVCGICGVSLPTQGKLNTHNRRHEKKHCCNQCDWRFSEARDLRRHVQSMHQQEQEPCPQCGKKFKRRGDNLRRHMTRYCKNKDMIK